MTLNRPYNYVITLFISTLLISVFLLQSALLNTCDAEITLDGSLGTSGPIAGPDHIISSDLGKEVGSNLFHSFSKFNVLTGESATFTGPNTIENIIGRVTGGSQSYIDGLLRSTIPGANLYLLNPSGVLFGRNATLDMSGSFHVSTADFIRLGNDGIFYANLSNDSVLTPVPPSAFGFLSNNPAAISIEESVLKVPTGKTLSIVGGDISITSDFAGNLWAPSGQINLLSVASPGEVNLGDLNTNSFAKLGNITVSQPSEGAGFYVQGSNYNVDPAGTIIIRGGKLFFKDSYLDARGNPGGIVNISGEQLYLDDTYINTGTRGAANHPGTAVDINVTGDILFTNGSEIASSSFGAGRAGDVRITTGNIQLGDDDAATSLYASTGFYGDIGSRAFGSGRGGDVYITADSLTVKNSFFINTAALSTGDAGNVTVHAGTIKLLDGGSISSNGFGTGRGGTVDIVAGDALFSAKNITNVPNCGGCFTGLAAQTNYGSKGGMLRLTADSLQILDGAKISTTLWSVGPGANIEITAKNILLSGVVIDSRIDPPDIHAGIDARLIGTSAKGTGGNINIKADNLQITNGGYINSSLFKDAPGNAGNITIQNETLEVSDRGRIFASSVSGTGNAGHLDITASDVHIIGIKSSLDPFGKDFTGFSTATNAGQGGDLRVTADSLTVTEKGMISSASLGLGPGGSIDIGVNNIRLSDGALVSAEGSGAGNAGNINITATDLLLMRDSSVTTEAKQADGGNIQVNAQYMVHLIDSKITASVGGGPETVGGNITIDPEFIILNDSKIIANAYEGKGGNIRIVANVFLADPGSLVDASSALGINGTVDIRAPITNLSGSLAPLQQSFLSAASLLQDPCEARISGEKYSSFIIVGRDGLPTKPGSVLPSPILH